MSSPVYQSLDPDLELVDWTSRADKLVGQLCMFREPPAILAIVRVLTAQRRDGCVFVTFEVVASSALDPRCELAPGSTHDVSASGACSVWRLFRLQRQTLDEAMVEVERGYAGRRLGWVRVSEPRG